MAGANNAFLKAVGFRAREVTKIRAKYGNVSSAKDATVAAGMAGVGVPAKLAARVAPAPSKLDRDTGTSLKNRVTDIVRQHIEAGVSTNLKMGQQLGKREGSLAKKLTDKQVQIMSVAQREMTSWQRTGKWDRSALKPHEWKQAERLLERV
jgi:hypothetical protein